MQTDPRLEGRYIPRPLTVCSPNGQGSMAYKAWPPEWARPVPFHRGGNQLGEAKRRSNVWQFQMQFLGQLSDPWESFSFPSQQSLC